MGSFPVTQLAVLMIFQLKIQPKLAVVCLLEYTVFAPGKATQHHPHHSLSNMRNLCNLRRWKTLMVHSHHAQILFPWWCMEEKKKEKSLAVSFWPSFFSVCLYSPASRQERTYNAPERTSDEERHARESADGCTPLCRKMTVLLVRIEKSDSCVFRTERRCSRYFYVTQEQFGWMGLWGCLAVALHAKKNVTAGTWSFSKKRKSDRAGAEADTLSSSWSLMTQSGFGKSTPLLQLGDLRAHTHARMCKALTLTCLISKTVRNPLLY